MPVLSPKYSSNQGQNTRVIKAELLEYYTQITRVLHPNYSNTTPEILEYYIKITLVLHTEKNLISPLKICLYGLSHTMRMQYKPTRKE